MSPNISTLLNIRNYRSALCVQNYDEKNRLLGIY